MACVRALRLYVLFWAEHQEPILYMFKMEVHQSTSKHCDKAFVDLKCAAAECSCCNTRGQHVVYQLQESFLSHVGISKEKDCRLVLNA